MFNQGRFLTALGCVLLSGATAFAAEPPNNPAEAYGPLLRSAGAPAVNQQAQRLSSRTSDTFRYWNTIAVDASGLDHTPVAAGDTRRFGEQLGPGRASRAMAIVHIAIFDAVNSILGGYRGYTGLPRFSAPASVDAAIAAAAHDTLVSVYPSQRASFDDLYNQDLNRIPARLDREKRNGIVVGKRAAALIVAQRANDGSNYIEPRMGSEWITNEDAGHWRQDPIGLSPIAMGAHWGAVKPFVIRTGQQFRAPPPPAMSSEAYTAAFNEVKRLGGDGTHTPTERSAEQSYIGIYWAYDGVPNLCAPPRLYNQVAREISKRSDSVQDLTRLFALVNVSMADAGIAIWESKFFYDFWRPVTGVREADEGTGPGGAGDGNPATLGDATFFPLGAPPSNLIGPGLHTAVSQLSVGARRVRRRFVRDVAQFLPNRPCFVHFRVRRIQWTDGGRRRHRSPVDSPQLHVVFAGGGGKRAEPNLSRYPLGVRQDAGYSSGPEGCRLCFRERFSAGETLIGLDAAAAWCVAPGRDHPALAMLLPAQELLSHWGARVAARFSTIARCQNAVGCCFSRWACSGACPIS